MDNEKDMFIKNKLQKDELISKKANDIFDKLNKGEFVMEEKTQETNETIVSEKKKSPKWKKVLATAASLVIVVGAANVYATTQGYDNIFFMIKYLITGEKEKISGKDNILSDRDITISYEPINITKELSIVVKKLQIEDNEAKLFVVTEEKEVLDSQTVPLNFKVFNDNNKKLCDQVSSREEQNSGIVNDELILKDYNNDYKILKLEIYKANTERITTLIINLDEKTVEVEGEKEALTKISEIELKQFLGYASGLSENRSDITLDEIKIDLACQMLNKENIVKYLLYNERQISAYPVEEVDNMVESFTGEKITNFKDGNRVIKLIRSGVSYYGFPLPNGDICGGECINISNISYCNGLYTVTYTYYYRGEEPDSDINMDSYDIYEQEIVVSLNENTKYSKFKVISKEEPSILKKAADNSNSSTEIVDQNNSNTTNTISQNDTNTNSNNNSNQNSTSEKIDNYATSMSWTEYWAPGLKFQYPTNFNLSEEGGRWRGNRGGEVSTIISGMAVGVNPDTKQKVESNLMIKVYEPQSVKGDVNKYIYNEVNGLEKSHFTTNRGLKWYAENENESVKEMSNVETYVHIIELNSGDYVMIKIEFHTDNRENYKVTNIINWMLGSTKTTSY